MSPLIFIASLQFYSSFIDSWSNSEWATKFFCLCSRSSATSSSLTCPIFFTVPSPPASTDPPLPSISPIPEPWGFAPALLPNSETFLTLTLFPYLNQDLKPTSPRLPTPRVSLLHHICAYGATLLKYIPMVCVRVRQRASVWTHKVTSVIWAVRPMSV